MARNSKTNTNPTGSSHGEQLVANRLTLPDNDDHKCDTDYDDDHGGDGNYIKLRENIWLQKKGNPR